MMSKYQPLQDYLARISQKEWRAHFSDIERIIGDKLPRSASTHREWWANGGHSYALSWLNAGWMVSHVSLDDQFVTFLKTPSLNAKKPYNAKRAEKIDKKEVVFYPWDVCDSRQCLATMEWMPVGKVTLDANDRPVFPPVESAPAIYRFRIRHGRKLFLYVGETDNLKRRFGNYRNPGPTQQTSLRIHALIKKVLKEGAEVSASAVTDKAWLSMEGRKVHADLSSKVIRCLFENMAILTCGGNEIETMNRAK